MGIALSAEQKGFLALLALFASVGAFVFLTFEISVIVSIGLALCWFVVTAAAFLVLNNWLPWWLRYIACAAVFYATSMAVALVGLKFTPDPWIEDKPSLALTESRLSRVRLEIDRLRSHGATSAGRAELFGCSVESESVKQPGLERTWTVVHARDANTVELAVEEELRAAGWSIGGAVFAKQFGNWSATVSVNSYSWEGEHSVYLVARVANATPCSLRDPVD